MVSRFGDMARHISKIRIFQLDKAENKSYIQASLSF